MKSIIERMPIPVTGLFLGLAASGNLVQSYGENYRSIFGLLAFMVFIGIVLKLALRGDLVKKELENPVVASVYPTLTMGMMLLATYIKPLMPMVAPYFWGIAVILHGFLIIRFSIRFLKDYNIKKVFPSWYIVYVGIVVGSVTSPAFGMQALGRLLFWFGLATYFALLPVVLKRVFVVREIPEPALPTLVIMCAPASLLGHGDLAFGFVTADICICTHQTAKAFGTEILSIIFSIYISNGHNGNINQIDGWISGHPWSNFPNFSYIG